MHPTPLSISLLCRSTTLQSWAKQFCLTVATAAATPRQSRVGIARVSSSLPWAVSTPPSRSQVGF